MKPDKLVSPYKIGDRVVQMMIRRLDAVELVMAESIDIGTARGEGGFGSTGT